MNNLLQDLVYGLRWLRTHPAFTVLSVATLAAGIGVNTAMFSVIHAVLLNPLPYHEADRIVWMSESGDEVQNRSLSYPNFKDWRERSQSFVAMSLFRGGRVNITGSDQAEILEIRVVSHGYFTVMHATPALGRDFTADDDQPGTAPVTMISYAFWQRRFGGDPNIVSQSIQLDEKPHTIIGVMAEQFKHHGPPPLWLLAGQQRTATRDVRNAGNVIARLKPGLTIDQGRSEINQVAAQLLREHPVANGGANRVNVVSLHENITGRVGWALKILFGAVALVLFIACANVANLLLARAASRQKEFAVRAALGASRWRIARQLLVESLILSVTGGLLGLMIAWWIINFLAKVAHHTVPRMDSLQINYRVLAFNLGVSVLTGILFGMIPALRFSKVKLQETLKDQSSTSTDRQGKHLRGVLVVSEVALSVALLVGAGLLVKSMLRLFNSDVGYNPDNVLTMGLRVSSNRYQEKGQLNELMHEVLKRVEAQPGVQSATLSNNLPGTRDGWQNDIAVEGEPPRKRGELINVDWSIVTADYFKTMNIPLVRGRTFTKDEEERGLPVVLVDENLARRYWPNEDAVGKHIAYDSPTWHEIIGVVKEVRFYGSEAEPLIKIYTPFGRAADSQRTTTLSVRSSGVDPSALAAGIIREINAIEKDLPVTEVSTFNDVLAREVATRKFNTWLFAALAGLALVLAATGVYGVISYSVARRTHEVGIRMALGAGRREVLRLFISQGMRLIVLGLIAGLAGSYLLTRLMSSLLFGVSTTDKITFILVSGCLLIVGFLACYLPARRATKVDPLVALRYE
jgi:putative ABC transport system permease protein